MLGVESPRPLLAIPHLLNQESAASYQGYLLAHMAVYQTRAFFLRTHGYLTDNPAIGPALAEHYWAPGNSVDHDTTLRSLTGEGFSARYLADECNQSVDEVWDEAQRKSMAAAATRAYPDDLCPSISTPTSASSMAPRCWPTRAPAKTRCARASRPGWPSTFRLPQRSDEAYLAAPPGGIDRRRGSP